MEVKYAPGMLEARASNNGSVLLTAANETAGAPAKLALTTDRVQIHADGEDVSIVATRVLDAANRIVPELLTKSLSI